MADQSGVGALREGVVRCGAGHVIVVAVGERALLTVMGDDGLDIAAFQHESPATVDQLSKVPAADVASCNGRTRCPTGTAPAAPTRPVPEGRAPRPRM